MKVEKKNSNCYVITFKDNKQVYYTESKLIEYIEEQGYQLCDLIGFGLSKKTVNMIILTKK